MKKLRNLSFHLAQSVEWHRRRRARQRGRPDKPIDIVYCMVDHYEPGTGDVDEATERARVEALVNRFPELSERHRDADGRTPKRTWFFPPHYHRHGHLEKLVRLCSGGFGEIELHLHHGKHAPDTADNLEATLRQCVDEYGRFGIFGEIGGSKRYAFIHGDSALDNSRAGAFCGVNNELDVLQRTGCYADFTHPSGPSSTPSLANAVFYARGKAGRPKGHDTGTRVRVGARGEGLMIVQGPSHPIAARSYLGLPRMVGDHVPATAVPTDRTRVRRWIDSHVCVEGRDDLVLVKTSTHGAPFEADALGGATELILRELEDRYNDGRDYRLHYATAREMYNVIRCVEDGRFSDVSSALDYEVSRPVYDTGWRQPEASDRLKSLVWNTYRG